MAGSVRECLPAPMFGMQSIGPAYLAGCEFLDQIAGEQTERRGADFGIADPFEIPDEVVGSKRATLAPLHVLLGLLVIAHVPFFPAGRGA
jgi:hypothetical protein